MKTIIQELKDRSLANVDNEEILVIENKRDELQDKVDKMEDEIEELNGELEESIPENECDIYETALGRILIKNVSGNLQLQYEIEEFFALIHTKYN